MGQHRDQVAPRLGVHPRVPQPQKFVQALHQDRLALVLGLHDGAGHGLGGGHVRPVGQFAPLVEGKVEQGRQHLGGQFDRHPVDPVEGLAPGQGVQDRGRPLANDRLHIGQVGRRDDRADGLALGVVPRRVHGDEAGPAQFGPRIADGDPAQGRVGGEHPVIGVHGHDVVIAGDRPIGAELAVAAVMDRRLPAQPLEPGPVGIGAEQLRVTGVEIFQGRRIGLGPRVLGQSHGAVSHGPSSKPIGAASLIAPLPPPGSSRSHRRRAMGFKRPFPLDGGRVWVGGVGKRFPDLTPLGDVAPCTFRPTPPTLCAASTCGDPSLFLVRNRLRPRQYPQATVVLVLQILPKFFILETRSRRTAELGKMSSQQVPNAGHV